MDDDHRDCGAAEIAYGAASIANPQIETETHREVFDEFRKEVSKREPKLLTRGLLAWSRCSIRAWIGGKPISSGVATEPA